MPRDLDKLVADLTADHEAVADGLARAMGAVDSTIAREEWRGAQPIKHGDAMTITATFDGEERQFFVKPEHAGIFDACCPGGSAYATLQRFVDKSWTVDDVAVVLSFALYGPTAKARLSYDMARTARQMGLGVTSVAYAPHPDVLKIVTRDGPANYAQIAVDVLTAVLFREAADAA
jgi:hypothetical protein